MRCLVLGAGLMGKGVVFDLANNPNVEQIIIADIDMSRAESLSRTLGSRVTPTVVDARDREQVSKLFSRVDAVASCISYTVNLMLTEVAVENGVHLTDLGGNLHVVKRQLELHDRAMSAGVTIIPDCGLAPGLVNVLARAGIDYLERAESVRIRVGGLPQQPLPPLNYSLVFSVEGLINEYVEPCMVLREGKIVYEEPLTGIEQIDFPPPFNRLEAFNTSGGTSTLPLTYEGRIKSLDYKTIRYPGHGHTMWCMMRLGLMDSSVQDFDGVMIAPRRVLERLIERNLPPSDRDVTLLRVTIEGWKNGASHTVEYEMIDYYDDKSGLTSMMRTTAFPQSIATTMIMDGRIKDRGVLPPERCIPPEPLVEELAKRGVIITQKIY